MANVKFPFVVGYSFDRIEIPEAEKLLAEYNDFYAYNLAQYQSLAKKLKVDEAGEINDDTEEIDEFQKEQLEKQSEDDAAEFTRVWGSMDFASGTLLGLAIEWDKIQEILIEEQRQQVRAKDSSMNAAGNKLRNVASVLTFAERILSGLDDKKADTEMVGLIKQGFEIMLTELLERDIQIPEFHKEKSKFNKIKTVNGLVDYAQQLFILGK